LFEPEIGGSGELIWAVERFEQSGSAACGASAKKEFRMGQELKGFSGWLAATTLSTPVQPVTWPVATVQTLRIRAET
jgi:hypothetical protein